MYPLNLATSASLLVEPGSRRIAHFPYDSGAHPAPYLSNSHNLSNPHAKCSIPVDGPRGGSFRVRIASDREALKQAFRLLAKRYRARGYEAPSERPYRFTPHHVLPGTITLVAERGQDVVATMSLVPDTALLGLPMEGIYGSEVDELRVRGRRLAEATSLADGDLGQREFMLVFTTMIRLVMQYHVRNGGDTWVIAVNPRHSDFYRKALGFVPIGTKRSYPSVRDHLAEAFMLDRSLMRANAPKMYRKVFEEPLADEILMPAPHDLDHVPYFASRSTQAEPRALLEIHRRASTYGAPRFWELDGGRHVAQEASFRESVTCGA